MRTTNALALEPGPAHHRGPYYLHSGADRELDQRLADAVGSAAAVTTVL
jgi:hypothetical protein